MASGIGHTVLFVFRLDAHGSQLRDHSFLQGHEMGYKGEKL